jgi:hypothetical protein
LSKAYRTPYDKIFAGQNNFRKDLNSKKIRKKKNAKKNSAKLFLTDDDHSTSKISTIVSLILTDDDFGPEAWAVPIWAVITIGTVLATSAEFVPPRGVGPHYIVMVMTIGL